MTSMMTVGNDSYCPLLKFDKFIDPDMIYKYFPIEVRNNLGRVKLKLNKGYVIYDMI